MMTYLDTALVLACALRMRAARWFAEVVWFAGVEAEAEVEQCEESWRCAELKVVSSKRMRRALAICE